LVRMIILNLNIVAMALLMKSFSVVLHVRSVAIGIDE